MTKRKDSLSREPKDEPFSRALKSDFKKCVVKRKTHFGETSKKEKEKRV